MNLKPMSLNLNSTSDKAATAKKVNVFHRPDLSELVLKTDAVFSGAIRNPFRLVDDIFHPDHTIVVDLRIFAY